MSGGPTTEKLPCHVGKNANSGHANKVSWILAARLLLLFPPNPEIGTVEGPVVPDSQLA